MPYGEAVIWKSSWVAEDEVDRGHGTKNRRSTDFQNPALDVYARLHEAQLLHLYEPAPGICIVESPNVIERALKSEMAADSASDDSRAGSSVQTKWLCRGCGCGMWQAHQIFC